MHDPHRGIQAQRVGPGPARRLHDPVHIVLTAARGEIDRVAEHAIGGASSTDEVVGHVDRGEDAVHPGQGEVGRQQPETHEVDELRRQPPPLASQREREQRHAHQRDAEEDQIQTVRGQQPSLYGAQDRCGAVSHRWGRAHRRDLPTGDSMLTGLRLSGGTSPRRAGTAIVSATAVRWGRDDR